MIPFHEVGRLPAPGDNVAIATRRLEAGTEILFSERKLSLSHTILEGHRFAVHEIGRGEALTSWGMPFGRAIVDIRPGAYVVNEGVLEALRGRSIDFDLPASPNFTDDIPIFEFDVAGFEPAEQVPRAERILYFDGYDRGGARGVGTRNYIVVIGVSSRTAGFVRRLAHLCSGWTDRLPNVDGVVPIAHTEGDDAVQLNKSLVLRTLAGFFTHPNVGAALVVDHDGASVTGRELKAYLSSKGYPSEEVIHDFMTLTGSYAEHLEEGERRIKGWLEEISDMKRSKRPVSDLKIALQCGGSDAFSGISGNPLAAWVARAVIAQGGAANLAETDELIGAESYVLKKVRSEEIARRFLYVVSRFQERAARHGSSAAGNPSGGNKFRGLYNIYLKSLGAAMKRHPDVRLDAVIEYGEPMKAPGYYFMDSPGNDLESIAGQVASGCNMIFFVTGNGSITNFPFVPTIKIVTTSSRYALLSSDMDVNAGLYLDGESMETLGNQMLEQTIAVASGQLSVGEKAGHAQVQLWRNWRLQEGERLDYDPGAAELPGVPLPIESGELTISTSFDAVQSRGVGLVLPTSLCSGQIGNMAAERLNETAAGMRIGVQSFVSLAHTEGCGVSSGASESLFLRTMCGHLLHPDVRHALLLEHGCEKTHNDFFRNFLEAENIDTTRYGWASIQSDGGIEKVLEKVTRWFEGRQNASPGDTSALQERVGLSVGLLITEEQPGEMTAALAELARWIVGNIGSVLIPSAGVVDFHADLRGRLSIGPEVSPTLNYAQQIERPGFHIMAAPTWHVQELLTGMGATGVRVLLVVSDSFSVPSHPFIPTLQIGCGDGASLDWRLEGEAGEISALADLLIRAQSGAYEPMSRRYGHQDFQISRGWKGVSL